jgi:hypothetical protein
MVKIITPKVVVNPEIASPDSIKIAWQSKAKCNECE